MVEAAPRDRIRVHEGESVVTETVEHPGLVGGRRGASPRASSCAATS